MFTSPFHSKFGFYSVHLSEPCSVETLLPLLHREEQELLARKSTVYSPVAFCIGRLAAHAALAQVNLSLVQPILETEEGVLIWPSGIIGSIGFTDTHAVAAVARSDDAVSLGVSLKQLECDRRIAASDAEADALSSAAWRRAESYAQLLCLFSAKESVIKALTPLTTSYVGFMDITLRWDAVLGSFKGMLQRSLSACLPKGLPLEVGCKVQQGYVFTHIAL